MDVMKSSGESSSRGQEDGDDTTGFERPLKKARFAWQVKGKYHLKNDTEDSNKNLTRAPTEPLSNESTSTSQGPINTLESNIENYLVRQEYCKLDYVKTPEHSDLFTPISNLNAEQYQYPRYTTSSERSNKAMRSNRCNSFRSISTTDTEDQCIAQWQAKQILNGCVDNTLNQVLESWTTDAHPQFMTRDFAEFINHLPGDNSVENEGILMAISAHGLQNTSSSSSTINNVNNCSMSSTLVSDIQSPLRSVSPVVSDDDLQINKIQQHETDNKVGDTKLPDWQSDSQNASDSSAFAYLSEPSQSPYFYHDNFQNSSADSFEIDNNFDFMNAAVMYAIKSKGLTASGTEYG